MSSMFLAGLALSFVILLLSLFPAIVRDIGAAISAGLFGYAVKIGLTL